MASTRSRRRLAGFALLPAVAIAVGVLGFFAVRTTMQLDTLRRQSVLEATLGLATEKANRLDRRIIEEDNVVQAVTDPAGLLELTERWLPTSQRETPTVRAILVLDEHRTVLAFASRAGGAWADEETFRRLLVQRMMNDMELAVQAPDELRHLHREYGGQSYLVSYWRRSWVGRSYVVVAWHDVARIVKEMLPTLYAEASGPPTRANVVDEEGRIIYGPPLRSGEFLVGVRFPTTLYNWRLQVSPKAAEELTTRARNRRVLEITIVVVAGIVLVAGVGAILVAAERERRISAMKGDFVADVSHELKTPLALIHMFSELLSSGRVGNDDKQKQYLGIIMQESERLSALIENVLDFARAERGKIAHEFAEASAADIVQRVTGSYRARFEREGIALDVQVGDGLPSVKLDRWAIESVVQNLLENALKYAPQGERVEVRLTHERDVLVLRVRDHGPGIPPEDRQRIFERFVRLRTHGSGDRVVRGSGMGLALVKESAEAHGGRAWVESQLGKGSTFVVTLAKVPPRAQRRQSRKASE